MVWLLGWRRACLRRLRPWCGDVDMGIMVHGRGHGHGYGHATSYMDLHLILSGVGDGGKELGAYMDAHRIAMLVITEVSKYVR